MVVVAPTLASFRRKPQRANANPSAVITTTAGGVAEVVAEEVTEEGEVAEDGDGGDQTSALLNPLHQVTMPESNTPKVKWFLDTRPGFGCVLRKK